MNLSGFRPSFLCFVALILIGCNIVAPTDLQGGASTSVAIAWQTALPITREATTMETVAPTLTSFPTNTWTPLPNTPTATSSPTPTPTLYPDAWISGILWQESQGKPTIYAGNSSVGVFNSLISYESINETIAAEIARYSLSTLVVFYGDYTPQGQNAGHIMVERVKRVNLPYSQNTPFSESHTNPLGFSFSYPERWTLRVNDSGDYLSLFNRPADEEHFSGPGIEYIDPTSLGVDFFVRNSSVKAYLQTIMDSIEEAKNAIPDYSPTITVSQREINGLSITQIKIDQLVYSNFGISYLLALRNGATLVIATSEEAQPVAERLLTTLSLEAPGT